MNLNNQDKDQVIKSVMIKDVVICRIFIKLIHSS